MHQFTVEPLFGHGWQIAGHSIAFTNSAAWMAVVVACLWLFMLGGMKRELVPGRWQMAVEGFTGFVTNMIDANIGPKGRAYVPYVFSLFMFILFADIIGLLPTALFGVNAFTVTSHLTVTGVLAILSFSIVLVVGFVRHKLHFFSLFIPHGTPWYMVPLIFLVELLSFMIRPFSLGLRLFVAMTAGHVLMEVLAGFVISGYNTGSLVIGPIVIIPSFLLMVG